MKNIEEQQIIIECPNTIFHLYIDSEDELSKIKVFMNIMKNFIMTVKCAGLK